MQRRIASLPTLLAAAVAVVAGGTIVSTRLTGPLSTLPGPARPDPPLAASRGSAAPRHPVPERPVRPLPRLDESDGRVREALCAMREARGLAEMLAPRDIIRRFVATVDAATRMSMPPGILPLAAPPPRPEGGEGRLVLGPADFARYAPYVAAAGAVDPKRVVSIYGRFYPLLQQAYADLGHPHGYFNDRLVDVIDELLDTPQPDAPVELVRADAHYRFADPGLESRSAGQKLLLRMGAANMAVVKRKLREIRKLLALHAAPG